MKIAIVGAGISGLTCAHLLHQKHEVTVFEAAEHIGGHTNTVQVELDGESHAVDTGFIVFNDRNYPNFERLLSALKVPSQPSDMSFGVSDQDGSFEYAADSMNALFATRSNLFSPRFYRMVFEVPRFQRACRALLSSDDPGPSLRKWLDEQRFSAMFIERLIVPQVAAVWSADPEQLWSFPARMLAQFFENHGMLELRGRPNWRVVEGGSAAYVRALTAPFKDRIRANSAVAKVTRSNDQVTVQTEAGSAEQFDEVILATHSDQALAMLSDATEAERSVLGAIDYKDNEVVLHTDVRLLPRRRRAWASWNYHLLTQASPHPTVTYYMNRLQSIKSRHAFCVTLNMTKAIDPDLVISTHTYAHPVFTADALHAQTRFDEISGHNRTSFCGAYWRWGFHEDGVFSALRVCERFGAAL